MKKLPLILIVSMVFGVLNFKEFMIGLKPNLSQGVVSILFVILWGIYSFFMAHMKSKHFLRVIALYWIIGTAITLITTYLNLFILSIPLSCIILTPLYGVCYFFSEPVSKNLWWLAVFLPYIAGVAGYFLEKVIKSKVSVKV